MRYEIRETAEQSASIGVAHTSSELTACIGQLLIVLTHLRVAKQRFKCTADPTATVAFVRLSIVALTAFASSVRRRNSDERARTKALLRKLQKHFA